jgi:hypothetical protein
MTIYLLVTHSKFHMKIGNVSAGGEQIQFETIGGREFFMKPTAQQVNARKEHFKLCLELLPDENNPDLRFDDDNEKVNKLLSVVDLLQMTGSDFKDISLDDLKRCLGV